MNRQEFYRQKYRSLNPSWQDSLTIYKNQIDLLVGEKTRVLDIGCGYGDLLKEVFSRTRQTYGIDPDGEALKKNKIIRHKTVGQAETLPYKDNYFDIVVNAWVMEHLSEPKRVIEEIYRVLKPGGRVVFLTPNTLNYNVWLARMVPNAWHDFFTRRLYNRQENDTYPAYYRANSAATVNRLFLGSGFKKLDLVLNGDPSYISFNSWLFKLACLIEKVLSWPLFSSARVHLIGVYEKQAD
jgi:ubiquinone/menaquinone biosynthesis C-methylase UbiE